jgi:hypothetical protein
MRKAIYLIPGVVGLFLLPCAPAHSQGTQRPASGPGTFQCQAGEMSGVPEADARTVVSLTCQAIIERTHRTGAYRVAVGRLGSSYILTVTDETTTESRSVEILDLNETPTAAKRLAAALLERRDVAATARVGQILASETRELLEKRGKTKWLVGAVGVGFPSRGTGVGAGVTTGVSHETPRYGLAVEMIWADASDGDKGDRLFFIGPGFRYYFSDRAFSPFISGGAGLTYLRATDGGTDFSEGSRTTFAPYVEGGLQLMRFERSRFTAGARVYLPPGTVKLRSYHWDQATHESRETTRDLYLAPITFGVTVTF